MADDKEKNYYRLITLVVKVGTKTLRRVVIKHIPEDTALEQFLTSHKEKINELKSKGRVLTDPQYQLLNEKPPDLEKFDISLLTIIIRNLCNTVEKPLNGWDTATVPKSETTVGSHIIRIRNLRNKTVGHEADTNITNANYEKYWNELVGCLRGLANHIGREFEKELEKDIKNIEKLQLSSDDELQQSKQLEATLKTWHMHEMHMKLCDLNDQVCKQAESLNSVLEEVRGIRNYFQRAGNSSTSDMPGPSNQVCKQAESLNSVLEEVRGIRNYFQRAGNSSTSDMPGPSNQPNQAQQTTNYTTVIDTYMKNTESLINAEYSRWVAISTRQTPEECQHPVATSTNPNSFSETEIDKFAKEVSASHWETFAIYLGYRQTQIDVMKEVYPRQIETLIRNMIQKWHDIVTQFDDENPKELLSSAFCNIRDNLTAEMVLGTRRDWEDLKKLRPKKETEKKIQAISFDFPCQSGVFHVVHHFQPLPDLPNSGIIIQEMSDEIDDANARPALMDVSESSTE